MMENASADDLIEAALQFTGLLNGKLVDLKIAEILFSLEFLRTAHARCAEVDPGNPS